MLKAFRTKLGETSWQFTTRQASQLLVMSLVEHTDEWTSQSPSHDVSSSCATSGPESRVLKSASFCFTWSVKLWEHLSISETIKLLDFWGFWIFFVSFCADYFMQEEGKTQADHQKPKRCNHSKKRPDKIYEEHGKSEVELVGFRNTLQRSNTDPASSKPKPKSRLAFCPAKAIPPLWSKSFPEEEAPIRCLQSKPLKHRNEMDSPDRGQFNSNVHLQVQE